MTDEQIIKALECCSKEFGNCEGCPYDDDNSDCVTIKGETLMIKDALDLINRQKAEIERLKEYETALKKGCALSRCINKGFVQDEAYKEFAERLHQNCEKYPYTLPSVFTNIEITYKELTEGGNEDG